MEPITLALLHQIQVLKHKIELPKLPPGTVLDLLNTFPKPSYLIPMDGSVQTLDRPTYVDMDAAIGLQGNLQGVDSMALPGGYTGPLYWIGDCFATNNGGLFWWNQQTGALVYEQIGSAVGGPRYVLATTLPGWGRDLEHAALVMSYPTEGTPRLEFYHATGTGHLTWTQFPDTIFPLEVGAYNLYTSAPDCVIGDLFYAAAFNASAHCIHFYVKDTRLNVGRLYSWYTNTPGDPGALVCVDGISNNDFDGFVSPIMPILSGSNNRICVIGATGPGELVKLRAFRKGGDAGNTSGAYPNMIMFNDSGFPLAWGQGNGGRYFYAVPPVSTMQYNWSHLRTNVYQEIDLQERFPNINSLGIYGSSWNRVNAQPGSYYLTGGQKSVTADETTYNYPLLLAAWGFRNFNPITHTSFDSLTDAKFRSGMLVTDPSNPDGYSFLMHVELGNGNGQLLKIRMGGDAGIPVPTSTPPAGMSRYLYPGRALDYDQPMAGGGGGSSGD